MDSDSSGGRTVLVTGASGGIGAELTRVVAGEGFDVVLTARREERLDKLARNVENRFGVTASVIPKDLADPAAPRELFDAVQASGHDVHTLANIAGYPVYGRFDDVPLEEQAAMMQVNMVALTQLMKLFVEPMLDRGDGAILNMASAVAYYPMPRLAVYAATKAYVLSFSQAMAHELADTGVQVTTVCPASVDTEVYEINEVGETKLAQGALSDPRSVSEAAWNGLRTGDRLVKPSIRAKFHSHAPRVLPRRLAAAVGANVTRKTSE